MADLDPNALEKAALALLRHDTNTAPEVDWWAERRMRFSDWKEGISMAIDAYNETKPDAFELVEGTGLPIFADGYEYINAKEVSTGKIIQVAHFVQYQGADDVGYEERKAAARVEGKALVAKMNGKPDA